MSDTEILKNPRLFVPYWFAEKQFKIKANLVLDKNNRVHELSLVLNAMWLDSRELLREYNDEVERDFKIKGFPEQDLKKALEEFLEVKRQEALEEIKAAIKYTGESFSELERFLVAITGRSDEVEFVILKHLLWQVKRKMFNKKTKEHMMLILRGLQGAGKTEAIKIIFSVIKAWFKSTSLKEITDDRWRYFFKNAYAVFCDELQHAEWTSVDALKNIITAEEFESRKLGTNTYDNLVQNATFIGASNKPLSELIKDSTGMRRFFEIITLDKMDWTAINQINVLRIWQSIDENQDDPYILPYKEKIRAIQSDLIVPDVEEEFLLEFKLNKLGNPTKDSVFVSNTTIYSVYEYYCERHGERKKSSIHFHKKIKARGLKKLEARSGHSGIRGYWIPEPIKQELLRFKENTEYHLEVGKMIGKFDDDITPTPNTENGISGSHVSSPNSAFTVSSVSAVSKGDT